MDHQASSGSKINTIAKITRKFLTLVALLAIGLGFPLELSLAQIADNPLTKDISVSGTVLEKYLTPPPPTPIGPPGVPPVSDALVFKGLAYPNATITLIKNGVLVTRVAAGMEDGLFEIHIQTLPAGTYSFGIKATDQQQNTSKLLTFTVFVSPPITTTVSGIFIPPTITSDKLEVKRGDPIIFLGKAAPNTEVRISFNADPAELLKKTRSDSTGAWSFTLNSGDLGLGDFTAKARSVALNDTSPYSDELPFRVGTVNRLRAKVAELGGFKRRCDLNNDNRVNLLDFSIMAFWYKRIGFPKTVDLSGDGRINLTDLSILAYCWTG